MLSMDVDRYEDCINADTFQKRDYQERFDAFCNDGSDRRTARNKREHKWIVTIMLRMSMIYVILPAKLDI